MRQLAKRFGVVEVTSLTAFLNIRPWRKRGLTVEGALQAVVVQECVVTLDPLEQTIEEEVFVRFAPEDAPPPKHRSDPSAADLSFSVADDDPPEPMFNDTAEVGEALSELLAMSLDPYPRKPEAVFTPPEDPDDDEPDEPETHNPFAVLKDLKDD